MKVTFKKFGIWLPIWLVCFFTAYMCTPTKASAQVMQTAALRGAFLRKPAAEYHILTMDYADLTFAKFGCNRDYLAPEIECDDWRGRAALQTNFSILGEGFFRSYLHGEGTASRFETFGWEYELGARLPYSTEIGWHHHSRHRLDGAPPHVFSNDWCVTEDKFPVEDSIFIRFIIWGHK